MAKMVTQADNELKDFIESVGDREYTEAEGVEVRRLLEQSFIRLTPENGCICPLCGTPVKYGLWGRYETLCEHASDPNGESPVRPTVLCTNRKCHAFGIGFWGSQCGGWYSWQSMDGVWLHIPRIIEPYTEEEIEKSWMEDTATKYHPNGLLKQTRSFRLKVWWAFVVDRLGAYHTSVDYNDMRVVVVWRKRKQPK